MNLGLGTLVKRSMTSKPPVKCGLLSSALVASNGSAPETAPSQSLTNRMQQDIVNLAEQSMEPHFLRLTVHSLADILAARDRISKLVPDVSHLLESLNGILDQDRKYMLEAVQLAKMFANSLAGSATRTEAAVGGERSKKVARQLGQFGGSDLSLSFHDVLQLCLVDGGIVGTACMCLP